MSRGYCCVGLNNPKSDINVGHALRACGIFGVNTLFVCGHRYKKAATDTMKTVHHMPLIETDDLYKVIPFDCVPVAVELLENAKPLPDYTHPERAFYIFGGEDQTLGQKVTSWCRDVIYIPSNGCLNLAACVNVVLYDRLAKKKASNK